MDNRPATRSLISQLAEDLRWLEEHALAPVTQGKRNHAEGKPEQGVQAAELHLAGALVRNCLGPYLEEPSPAPLHIAVVGGAGAGKSTIVNFLTGAGAAEANPQAGFTRHPIAYTNCNGALHLPAQLGFLGSLERLGETAGADLDRDVYQVRCVAADPTSAHILKEAVVWDCPDMTTWAARGYVARLLEIAAVADVLIYVASDERYNDELPTHFLQLLLQTGKPVIVCLLKMKEEDAPALIEHFQQEVLGKFPHPAIACLAIPFLTAEQLADPVRQASRFRIPLLNQVAVLLNPPEAARRRVVRGAARYLLAHRERLLGAARQDIAALEAWQAAVHTGQHEFSNRYRREYLSSEKFHSFDDALILLLDLLELPGAGRVVSTTLWVVRTPYRLLKGWLGKALSRPTGANLPETQVLEQALTGWLDLLHREAVRRAESNPVWAHLDKGFKEGLPDLARQRFEEAYRNFQQSLTDEVDQTARSIYEELEKKPVLLNTLRSGNFALDVAAIGSAFLFGHIGVQDFVLVPLMASLKQQIVELLGRQYVDNLREQIRSRQQLLVGQHIAQPLAEWLIQWPASGGSQFEHLQVVLRRLPLTIQQLGVLVQQAPENALRESHEYAGS
jgi:hypothetical protein